MTSPEKMRKRFLTPLGGMWLGITAYLIGWRILDPINFQCGDNHGNEQMGRIHMIRIYKIFFKVIFSAIVVVAYFLWPAP